MAHLIILDAAPPSLNYLTTANSTVNATSQTFSGITFGAARSDRVIIIAFGYVGTAVESSVTIGGVTATLASGSRGVAGGSDRCALYSALVPSGTSGSIVIASSATTTNMGVQVYNAYGLLSATATDAANDAVSPITTSVSVQANGLVVSYAYADDAAPGTPAWSGVTLNNTTSFGAGEAYSCASATVTSATTRNVTCANFNGTVVGCTASFR